VLSSSHAASHTLARMEVVTFVLVYTYTLVFLALRRVAHWDGVVPTALTVSEGPSSQGRGL
jgi:hypothetical protein